MTLAASASQKASFKSSKHVCRDRGFAGRRIFYVSGGVDDNLHVFREMTDGKWVEDGEAVKLGQRSVDSD